MSDVDRYCGKAPGDYYNHNNSGGWFRREHGTCTPVRTSTDRIDALEAENKRLAEAIRVLGDLYIHGSLAPPHYIHGTAADGKRYPMDRLRTLFGLNVKSEGV